MQYVRVRKVNGMYAVQVIKDGKIRYTYCEYCIEQIAYSNACNLAFELNCIMAS